MQARHLLAFARPPGIWSVYPRLLVSRKPVLVPDGGEVPRIEATLEPQPIKPRPLRSYRSLCGAGAESSLPIAYPHVLAMPLHLAILGAEAFPVRLFGLVHVANRIITLGPLPVAAPGALDCWIEGFRDTERGQEFDLHTRYRVEGQSRWEEISTFLARRRTAGTPRSSSPVETAPEAAPDHSSDFSAPAGLGRRYAWVSGDLNPIHLSRLTARPFGFARAIAHGLWTLARVATELGLPRAEGSWEYQVQFRSPVYLPSRLLLRRWSVEHGEDFVLSSGVQGSRPCLTGTLRSLR